MYKHARSKIKFLGGSKFRFRPFEPRSKTENRKWWFAIIKQAIETDTLPRQHTSRKLPKWLSDELEREGYLGWLSAVDRKTGQLRGRH